VSRSHKERDSQQQLSEKEEIRREQFFERYKGKKRTPTEEETGSVLALASVILSKTKKTAPGKSLLLCLRERGRRMASLLEKC